MDIRSKEDFTKEFIISIGGRFDDKGIFFDDLCGKEFNGHIRDDIFLLFLQESKDNFAIFGNVEITIRDGVD